MDRVELQIWQQGKLFARLVWHRQAREWGVAWVSEDIARILRAARVSGMG